MARSRRPQREDHVKVERTRTSSAWIAVGVAVIFLILLIIFIAQNGKSEPLHFLGASGKVPLGLALLVAAVAGAAVVFLVGAGRTAQLRLAARRHNREAKRRGSAGSVGAGEPPPAKTSGPQTVETERQT